MQWAGAAVAAAAVIDWLLALSSFSDLCKTDGYLVLSCRSVVVQAAWISRPFECCLWLLQRSQDLPVE